MVPFEADLNTGRTALDDERYADLPGPLLQDVALVVTWNQSFASRQILVRVAGEGPDCPPRTECRHLIEVIGDTPLHVHLRGIAFWDAEISVMDQDASPLGANLGQGFGNPVHLQGNVTVQYVD